MCHRGGNPEGRRRVNRSSPHIACTRALLIQPPAQPRRGQGRERSSARPRRTWLQLSCGGSAHAPLSWCGCPAEEDTDSNRGGTQHWRDSSAPHVHSKKKKKPQCISILNPIHLLNDNKMKERNKNHARIRKQLLFWEHRRRKRAVKYTVMDESDREASFSPVIKNVCCHTQPLVWNSPGKGAG